VLGCDRKPSAWDGQHPGRKPGLPDPPTILNGMPVAVLRLCTCGYQWQCSHSYVIYNNISFQHWTDNICDSIASLVNGTRHGYTLIALHQSVSQTHVINDHTQRANILQAVVHVTSKLNSIKPAHKGNSREG